MKKHGARAKKASPERFQLRFQRRLREALTRQFSAAEAFGHAWEATSDETPLAEADEAKVFWALIRWAQSEELFAGASERELLPAWSESVDEL